MKLLKKFAAKLTLAGIVSALLIPASAVATDVRGKILELAVIKTYGNFVFIRMDTAPTPPSACATHAYWHYTLPLSADIDKRIFAMLMTAQTTGKSVDVFGSGSCSEFTTVESASGARLLP